MPRPNLGGEQHRFRSDVASAIGKCLQRGMDIELTDGRLILTSANGTRYYLAADNTGVLYLVDLATGTAQALPATAASVTALTTRVTTLEGIVPSAKVKVRARRATSTQSLTSGSAVTAIFNTEDQDTHSAYDNTTGIFTAPVAGLYLVTVGVGVAYSGAAAAGYVEVDKNGTTNAIATLAARSTTDAYATVAVQLDLAVNDTVNAKVLAQGTSPVLVANPYARLDITLIARA